MVRKKNIWIAKVGDNYEEEYPTKKEAEEAESEYFRKKEYEKQISVIRKYFPAVHEKTSSYHIYCVDCGKMLYEYEHLCGPYISERGDLTRHHESFQFFDGERCEECHKKAHKLCDKMLKFYGEKKKVILIIEKDVYKRLADMCFYKSDKNKILNIYNIVEFWDKEYKKIFTGTRKNKNKVL